MEREHSPSSHVVVALVRLPSVSRDTCWLTWLLFFFFFRHPNFSPNIDNIYIIFELSRKKWIPVKNITAIALGEEVEKKIPNKERLSEHDETSIKFLKEAIKFHF